jgi:hypothetical protein
MFPWVPKNWKYFGKTHHENFFIDALINLSKIRKRGIYVQIFSKGSNAVTQIFHQSFVRISSAGYSKSRQNLVCVWFPIRKIANFTQTKTVLWDKRPLNKALPSGSSDTWTEQFPLASSVCSYPYLEGQGSKDPRPGILQAKHEVWIDY